MSLALPETVQIREQGPRDGLQNEPVFLPTDRKVKLINALSETGLQVIAATSFVHPAKVPQLRDAEEVMASIRRVPGVTYVAFVPNEKGLERAIRCAIDGFGVGVSASDTFSRRNVNRSRDERYAEIPRLLARAEEANLLVDQGTISMAFGCPFEGEIPPQRVIGIAKQLHALGVETICLADTIGIAHPAQVYDLFCRLQEAIPGITLASHFHDTYGRGLANALAALQAGCRIFDSSIGGLGGCPFAPGAAGNIATEDLVSMLEGMGIRTGIDLERIVACARLAEELIGRPLPGHVLHIKQPRVEPEQSGPSTTPQA